ncbi:virion structural protein [Pseudomonas phage PhiPA3]|uniref:Virion structural protein n=1 Tax=Pseudomonas phage PhiPA3 TaxID=998086 RepID=F8SK52_BPPA3|nr:virion structural protein [Pseudomonas phage PhiPA3]AEH03604.1 virion structural protein [Pseudomonas phage PhiPA3]
MYILKGFYSYPALISNVPDVVAKFGELSSNSSTYAKDKTIHTGTSTPNTCFISFHSVKDETTVVDLTGNMKDQVLKIGEFIYQQSIQGTIRDNPDVLRQLVMAEFGTKISTFTSGRMLTNNTIWMPEYVKFTVIEANNPNEVTIWLCDESFAAQYDEYEIEIVHPLVPYDQFFQDPLIVKQLLEAYDLPAKLEEVQAARGDYPYTFLKAFMFAYHNPRDTTMQFPAHWIAIVYGQAGNNPDLIKDKIVKEILEGSTHPREEWEVILPDLFLTTEYIFTPFWNQYSVPNSDFRAGIYSPTVDPRKRVALLRRTARGSGYTDVWVNNNYELSANIYKSIAFGAIGNPKNRGGITKFSQKWPDYMIVSNDSPDIDRMSPDTVAWTMLFSKLLKAAEAMTLYTSVPAGVSRMVRDGVIYASAYYKNVNYMVVSKASVEQFG